MDSWKEAGDGKVVTLKQKTAWTYMGGVHEQKKKKISKLLEDVSTSVAFHPQLLSGSRKQSDAGKEGACSATVS